MKDPKKYLKQYAALEEAAKAEIIEILSNNPTGRYIWFNCAIEEEDDAYDESLIEVMDGNARLIHICAVGLNDENQIVITDATMILRGLHPMSLLTPIWRCTSLW